MLTESDRVVNLTLFESAFEAIICQEKVQSLLVYKINKEFGLAKQIGPWVEDIF